MKLQEIIRSLPDNYNPETERALVSQINALEVSSLTEDLADLLAFSISENYNILAKAILEKDYKGRKLDMQSINQSIINQSEEGYSLLHFTAQFGNKEMLIYFLENQVLISTDKDQLSPLHTLTFAKNLNKDDMIEIIKKFQEIAPDLINQRDVFHLTPLHYAAHNDNMPALEALIDHGAKR